jgi:hypothetical protein
VLRRSDLDDELWSRRVPVTAVVIRLNQRWADVGVIKTGRVEQDPKDIQYERLLSFKLLGYRQINSAIGASTCPCRFLLAAWRCQGPDGLRKPVGESGANRAYLIRPASSWCADQDHEISWWPVVSDTIITALIRLTFCS